jgi:hypothetical protein
MWAVFLNSSYARRGRFARSSSPCKFLKNFSDENSRTYEGGKMETTWLRIINAGRFGESRAELQYWNGKRIVRTEVLVHSRSIDVVVSAAIEYLRSQYGKPQVINVYAEEFEGRL